MQLNDHTPLSSFPSLPPSGSEDSEASEHAKKKWKKAKKKAKEEKKKRKKVERKLEDLDQKLKAERAMHEEHERNYKQECEEKYRRQLINFLYPDLDRILGKCFGGDDQDES